ncbi:UTP--glucose-1-phosphate uridylyltransferase [Psilocybe cubensis]|uniref:UTP--glucose-1-phosphate uridylyltransferase n=1 Tax=Psilocybe cubensis TaxID=181762 RepID=A0ACB8HCW7_PSICU|nr:UTP--glucose-1-phosphate uridylyltransferase [Psilocybe cubensis]KAH9485029.1 UTP--glucose-1-phosphate uridylyltransferase [Psilocybe cubensis]
MPLFKQPISRLRRRPAKYFPELPSSDVAKPMSDELDRLVSTVRESIPRKLFIAELLPFLALYRRYRSELSEGPALDWQQVKPLEGSQMIPYDRLSQKPESPTPTPLDKLAVLKVNGGLGTSMGMNGAKSALEVQNKLTFLDLVVQQIEHLNATYHTEVPLILMTSFNTEDDTLRIVKKYANRKVKITTFNQSRYPRILKETLLPFAKSVLEGKSAWYPPGHGDLYNSLHRSGVLDNLLAQGKEYLFVSNSDNLGAVVDPVILHHMMDTKSEFVMEVTEKTKVDTKGGILINYDGNIRLLETTQIPEEHAEEFNQSRSFRMFNTNNLWINLKALKRLLEAGDMTLDIICSSKSLDDGRCVLQLETAAGSAIRHFQNAHGVLVPRARFLPVKDCSDLLLVQSDVFSLQHGRLIMNESRMFGTPPVIKLGGHFRRIQQFQKRFKQIPHLVELDHLTVAGDVYFGRDVTLRGTSLQMKASV